MHVLAHAIGRTIVAGDEIVVCDQAHEERGAHDTRHELHWSIPDPVRDGRPEAFAGAVGRLRERITYLAEHTARAS